MAKNKKMDSLEIEGQFASEEFGGEYMMLVDGSCYRFSMEYGFEPITRSYYGHVLKCERKAVLRDFAEMFRERSLCKKSGMHLGVYNLTKDIKDSQECVDEFNCLWTIFKLHIAADKVKRRAAKLASKQ